MKGFMTTPYQIKKPETGGAFGTYGAEENCIQGSGGKTWRK